MEVSSATTCKFSYHKNCPIRYPDLSPKKFILVYTITRLLQVASNLFFNRASPYWMHHYHFFRGVKDEIDTLGEAAVNNLIINSVVPLMVAYGKSKDDQGYVDKAVRILQTLHAESNMITKQWKILGIASRTAFDSQALVQLYNNYCLKRRCLECNIGASIVNPRNR